jgi:hypothetical protein
LGGFTVDGDCDGLEAVGAATELSRVQCHNEIARGVDLTARAKTSSVVREVSALKALRELRLVRGRLLTRAQEVFNVDVGMAACADVFVSGDASRDCQRRHEACSEELHLFDAWKIGRLEEASLGKGAYA